MNVRIDESWRQVLQPEFDKPYFELLTNFVRNAYRTTQCFPPAGQIFRAFDLCPFNRVRVVIIGQDPYHDFNQAHGLCFSVQDGVRVPPSLENIYKELNRDLGKPIPTSGNLTHWAEQGVLLLNATLTVEAHRAGSHQGKGWEELTDAAIQALNNQRENVVFMLWGSYAQRKGQFIDRRRHLVLTAVHPSPLSAYRGFIGCGHFSQANAYLQQHGQTPINW
ncbi:MAG: uracil-DNA glycosylase [Paludibacteraceae bacterium]|jgi:uracil-DNA glycosylase|nr:uracil-DNA glycosylase [Paludibacteraceae bacterium]